MDMRPCKPLTQTYTSVHAQVPFTKLVLRLRNGRTEHVPSYSTSRLLCIESPKRTQIEQDHDSSFIPAKIVALF
jgi:hypothetical protein